jgi:hypothetical protein
MGFNATPYTVTTALLAIFALFVIYTRLKNWLDSNVPLMFYVILLAYMRAVEGAVPLWLMLTGFGLAMVLRFEFLNAAFTRAVKFLDIGVLLVIVYFCMVMVLQL